MWVIRGMVIVAMATVVLGQRPKSCPPGTQYKKACNTCACAPDGKDKCSNFDCNRPPPTTAAPSKNRPGDCPTIVTPPPGSDICAKRKETSTCSEDGTCSLAKKCCRDGCNVKSCRNAIYRYT